ncbi:hypothetical protein COS21_01865 [bacterium (Candidatus Gribaldobacteria) CG02_land_8_20_14_3_00_41_15]|uniref:Transcriptional regulator, AbiEi antitoxin, Type IV TA system n=2 Tax=Candidatus Gribaldobacteria TaxID=2798536 RepID=A0A2H0UY56_9BACT|nr:MAG: hypothetical protein COU03_00450 [bacterium (Candidatus Gribaldobacteria) CG10_big_fil_rev_8_21_14_0_10_41_12]PIV47077.1 MAG: hypothetical protein COS21_01865 [bacterium (Candidatus Gribaldobacteria) CG02_land_8_20_14_3_00_41_15]
MDNLVAKIYQLPKTVLTNKDLALVWQETNQNNLKAKIAYYIKQGALLKITRGVFAKDKNYSKRELATSLYSPSYISFETVLRDSGIIFQHHETIFVAGKWTKQIRVDGQDFSFRKLKDELLFNPSAVISKNNYNIASQERAFLDTIYLFSEYYFDNLSGINWEKCSELVKIYKNQRMIKRLEKYQENYAK